MSRAYRVRFTSVSGDNLTLRVALLGILPEGDMAALLRDELVRDGWSREDDGALTLKLQGAEARLAPDGKTVQVAMRAEREDTAVLDTDHGDAESNPHLARQKAVAEERLKAEVAKALARIEPEVRARLDGAVQRAYVQALKQKAASLGQVESVQETRGADGEYEVTIKVRT